MILSFSKVVDRAFSQLINLFPQSAHLVIDTEKGCNPNPVDNIGSSNKNNTKNGSAILLETSSGTKMKDQQAISLGNDLTHCNRVRSLVIERRSEV